MISKFKEFVGWYRHKDDTLEIRQMGYTYIFKTATLLSSEEQNKVQERLKKGLAEGCLLLDGKITLVDVKPRYKGMVQFW